MVDIRFELFEWHKEKSDENFRKHSVGFSEASEAFSDPDWVLQADLKHSNFEQRWICVGRVQRGILTVRFTLRENRVRIIGAGFWRWGRRTYEKKNG